MQLRPHHVGIVVSDLGRSIAFYEALGFQVASVIKSEDDSRTITFMELGGAQIELFWYFDASVSVETVAARQLGFLHYALLADDVDSALAELKAKGLVPDDVVSEHVPAGFRIAFFPDPDGMQIELTQVDR